MGNKNDNQQLGGFTIVELLIATAVFATVLLLALTGFLQIGRIFYKGVSSTQTQDTTRQVVNDISANIKTASSTGSVQGPNTTAGGGYKYLCVGTYRYTFGFYTNNSNPAYNGRTVFYNATVGPNYDPGSPAASFGLLKDKVTEGACPTPCVTSSTSGPGKCPGSNFLALDTNNPTEMLGNGMRIGDISLSQPNVSTVDLYNLGVTIAYGADTVLAYTPSNLPYCAGNSQDQQFCAVDQLSTTVFRGELHP